MLWLICSLFCIVLACQSKRALDELVRLCHGRKTCTIHAEEYVFGNPCPKGVNKYLTVVYTCGKEVVIVAYSMNISSPFVM